MPEPDTIGAIPESRFEQDWVQDDMITLVLIPNDIKDSFKDDNLKFCNSNRICFQASNETLIETIDKLLRAIEPTTI